MSTSLLYHAFGVRGYQYTRTDYRGGQTIFSTHQEPKTCRCSVCGSALVQSRGQVERRFRAVPIGSRATFIDLPIPRVECRDCGVVRQVKVPFVDPHRSYTRSFERYALELGRRMTIRDVAMHLGVSWDTIKDLQKRALSCRFAARWSRTNSTTAGITEITMIAGMTSLTFSCTTSRPPNHHFTVETASDDVLEGGEVVTGMIVAETDEAVTLRQDGGAERTFRRADMGRRCGRTVCR